MKKQALIAYICLILVCLIIPLASNDKIVTVYGSHVPINANIQKITECAITDREVLEDSYKLTIRNDSGTYDIIVSADDYIRNMDTITETTYTIKKTFLQCYEGWTGVFVCAGIVLGMAGLIFTMKTKLPIAISH